MEFQTTTFIFMGDSHYGRMPGERSDYVLWGKLLSAAYSRAGGEDEPLLVLAGDLVNRVDNEEEWGGFFDAGGELLRRMPVIIANGNPHGRGSGRNSVCIRSAKDCGERFELPANGPEGLERQFYSRDFGCCHFLVLDSNVMGESASRSLEEKILGWIREDLARNDMPITFVLQHHPMVTVGTSKEDEARAEHMRRLYLPVLEEYGADMILCGHQHVYCRSGRIWTADASSRVERAAPGDSGLIQLMGVSGTKLYDAWDTSQMEYVREFLPVATVFRVSREAIRLETIDAEGNIIDEMVRDVK